MSKAERFLLASDLMRRVGEEPLGGAASESEISAAESELRVRFPESYVVFLREFGTASWPDYIYGLGPTAQGGTDVIYMTTSERSNMYPPMSRYLVAVSPDGWGNHYCLDTAVMSDSECPVVMWDHEQLPDQVPELVAQTFLDWLEARINRRIRSDAN